MKLFQKRTTATERNRPVLEVVRDMVNDRAAQALVQKHSLGLMSVSWEDCARSKESCWGPCISDMTLQVEQTCMPLIRYPNYDDLTWDIPMENVVLLVGNEKGQPLRPVTLRDYLINFRDYLHDPSAWPGDQKSLYVEEKRRDSHVIVSAQACFLPVPQGGEAKFNVNIYNYETQSRDPGVLAIVATASGTSAQIVDSCGGQSLYFNQNGQRASFIGQRLSDNRKERATSSESKKSPEAKGKEMTEEEKMSNMVAIIQVPLKQKNPIEVCCDGSDSDGCDDYDDDECEEDDCDVEDAIVKVGAVEGPFKEIDNVQIERDPSFPVRVTLQFYKATSTGEINDLVVRTIAQQIKDAQGNTGMLSSLVVQGNTGRLTEWVDA